MPQAQRGPLPRERRRTLPHSLPRAGLLGWLSRIGLGAQDEQLIITVEFTAAVKLKSITIVGSVETDSHPADLKVFLNRDDVDFDVRSFLLYSCRPSLGRHSWA